MSSPDSSTPPSTGDSLFRFHGSSPDSIFADSALLDWEYATNGCSHPLFPPPGGTFPDPKVASMGHYTMMGVSGFPDPTVVPSPPANMCPKEPSRRVAKRQMNTMAARRYRQRRLDRMNELEAELEAVKREREEWRVKASKLEGEASALKRLLESQKIKKET
ncbi:hypothetical protein N8T08_010182 [Aspergillus melleus]|uniref:Uncharacterized protein n=1 Tax=Aspergillus melleus TaxID=138277 RepID=A0ACC3BCJ1_9EURO|nr:hypothetical protein N8T08_010182 [Aspergillus melleus]